MSSATPDRDQLLALLTELLPGAISRLTNGQNLTNTQGGEVSAGNIERPANLNQGTLPGNVMSPNTGTRTKDKKSKSKKAANKKSGKKKRKAHKRHHTSSDSDPLTPKRSRKRYKSSDDDESDSDQSDSDSTSTDSDTISDSSVSSVATNKKKLVRRWESLRQGSDSTFAALAAAVDATTGSEIEGALRRAVDKILESRTDMDMTLRHVLSTLTRATPTHDALKTLVLAHANPHQQRQVDRIHQAMSEPDIRAALVAAYKVTSTWKGRTGYTAQGGQKFRSRRAGFGRGRPPQKGPNHPKDQKK